MNLLLKIT